jgi:import inner membrane translocase subunit TIM17
VQPQRLSALSRLLGHSTPLSRIIRRAPVHALELLQLPLVVVLLPPVSQSSCPNSLSLLSSPYPISECVLILCNSDHSRDPCPTVILSDFGGAFAMGAVGGTVWHAIKGARNSPKVSRLPIMIITRVYRADAGALFLQFQSFYSFLRGQGDRLIGSIAAVKARAPVVGGNVRQRTHPYELYADMGGNQFGIWGGLFSSFDCAVKGIRQKEDPWNAIIAGFFTGGCLAVRGGPKAAFGSAVGCGILLSVFEGALSRHAMVGKADVMGVRCRGRNRVWANVCRDEQASSTHRPSLSPCLFRLTLLTFAFPQIADSPTIQPGGSS